MNNPFIWLGISILLVAISLIALLTVAILTLQELARAARSAEKLLDTLHRELPATLSDLRLTGKEISGLTDEVSGGLQSARSVVEHVDQGIIGAKVQAQRAQLTTRSVLGSFFAGTSAALDVLVNGQPRRRRRPPTRRPPVQPISTASTAKPPVSPAPRQATVDLPQLSHKPVNHLTEEPAEKHAEKTHETPPSLYSSNPPSS